jgi:hypothetical protein
MENRNLETLAQELGLKKQQVKTVLELTAEGNTIPFIARYRKEKTGNLDETQIKAIIDMDKSLTALQDRKETVLAKIEAQGKLTDQPLKRLKSWRMWKNSTSPIRKNAAPKRLLPVKQVFSHWLVLSCKIVQTSRLKLKS